MKKNTFVYKFSFLAVMILIAATGCHRETLVQYVPREDLFTISYGKFEDQLIFDNMEYLGEVKPATLYMQDGFFYILSSVSKKVMQFNMPVTIGKNVWLGAGVIVLPGVHIGDHSVIGAGSVVTKDIPENCVAFGTPCRVIRPISEHDRMYYYRDRKIDPSLFE